MNQTSVPSENVLQLPAGSLRLTSLGQGRMILGELVRGSAARGDVLTAMGEFGIRYGQLDESIDLIAQGVAGEMPMAVSHVLHLPIPTTDEFFTLPLLEEMITAGQLDDLEQLDITFPVKAGETLLTVDGPAKTVIRHPDGRTELVRTHEQTGPEVYQGENTAIDDEGKAVVALIDGYAHRSVYGAISVYPAEKLKAMGQIQSRISKDCAIIVDLDVDTGSRIKIPSTLVVRGSLCGSLIDAGGSVHISLDTKKTNPRSESSITAGQNVHSLDFRDTIIKAGSHVIATQEISGCHVECMDTVVARKIHNSTITVGNRLIAEEISGDTRIHLGGDMDPRADLEKRRGIFRDHVRRFHDLEELLSQSVYDWNKTKKNLARLFKRMRDSSIPPGQRRKLKPTMDRLCEDMESILATATDHFKQFQGTGQQVRRERVELDYFRHRQEPAVQPYLLVLGRMAAGVKIKGPVDKLTVDETLSGIRFELDEYSGALLQSPLDT